MHNENKKSPFAIIIVSDWEVACNLFPWRLWYSHTFLAKPDINVFIFHFYAAFSHFMIFRRAIFSDK